LTQPQRPSEGGLTANMMEKRWTVCEYCGGRGFLIVADNGTNMGEESCDVCLGDGGYMANGWGDRDDE
jgi:hypothetical protein